MMKSQLVLMFIATTCATNYLYAETPVTIINNNNNTVQQPAPNQNANDNQGNNFSTSTQRPGTYYQSHPTGGFDTVYTTGDKTPYNADINSNNNNNNTQPIIQPFIYGPDQRPRPPHDLK